MHLRLTLSPTLASPVELSGTGTGAIAMAFSASGAGTETFSGAGAGAIAFAFSGSGSGSLFLPSSIANLSIWFAPDGINASDAVDSWTDKSANVFTIAETGTNRPSKLTAVLDGYNGVQAVLGSSQRLKRANTAIFSGNGHSFFMVIRVDAFSGVNNDDFFSNLASDFSKGVEVGLLNSSKKWEVNYFGIGSEVVNSVITAGSIFHIVVFSSAGDASTPTFQLDGSSQTYSATVNPSGFAPTTTPVLSLFNRGPNNTNHCSATVVEWGAYNAQIAAGDITSLRTYLKAKYPSAA